VIYLIYPIDPTTEFLLDIPKRIAFKHGAKSVHLIEVHPSDKSYEKALIEIQDIPSNSMVLFMGHGQADKLWGAESETYPKKTFISKAQSKIFSEKNLFLLSCNSNEFLKGTFSFSKVIASIGFGSLPTEMAEVEGSKKLIQQGVNEVIIKKYKDIIVELVSRSFIEMIEMDESFPQLSRNFMLRLNRKISQVILDDTKSVENRILADLLFQMKSEMVFI